MVIIVVWGRQNGEQGRHLSIIGTGIRKVDHDEVDSFPAWMSRRPAILTVQGLFIGQKDFLEASGLCSTQELSWENGSPMKQTLSILSKETQLRNDCVTLRLEVRYRRN
jgi:hypothetical protein